MTSCDNCHVVAVIGPCSTDISDALERLGAVPLGLAGASTTFWSWSRGTVPRGARGQQPTVPLTPMHGQGQPSSNARHLNILQGEPGGDDRSVPLGGDALGGSKRIGEALHG